MCTNCTEICVCDCDGVSLIFDLNLFYMYLPSFTQLRPPQPAVYLFVLDVSHNAVETGYLSVFCQSLLDNINAYVHHSVSNY